MRVIPPIAITEALLTSSSVSEPASGEATWLNTTYYKLGDRVIDTTTHRTYESLSGAQAVVTISIASPGVVTWLNHGLAAGTPVYLTTSGTLPSGLTANTRYYVVADTVDTFKLSSAIGGAAINTTGTQSGVHTATANPNRGHNPTTDDGTWWADVGPTNKWAMFDLLRNTATVGGSTLVVTITPGQPVDSIGLVGIAGESVRIQSVVSGVTVYDETIDLLNRPVTDWLGYYTAPINYRTSFVRHDVPPLSSAVITITVTRATGDATVGGVVMGLSIYLGETLVGVESDSENFSRIERDANGNVSLTPKRTIPKTKQSVLADEYDIPKLLLAREQLNAVPALYSGIDDEESAYFGAVLILGIYRNFTISFNGPNDVIITLELEEV